MGVGEPRRGLHKSVDVLLRGPVRVPSTTVLPMVWEPTDAPMFPRLEADLELASLGADRTQLAISGRYDPPLGVIGKLADRALLHRVAEATVKDFIDSVAHWLQVAAEELAEERVTAQAPNR